MFGTYQEIMKDAESYGILPKTEPGNYKRHYIAEREEREAKEAKEEQEASNAEPYTPPNTSDALKSILKQQDRKYFKRDYRGNNLSENEELKESQIEHMPPAKNTFNSLSSISFDMDNLEDEEEKITPFSLYDTSKPLNTINEDIQYTKKNNYHNEIEGEEERYTQETYSMSTESFDEKLNNFFDANGKPPTIESIYYPEKKNKSYVNKTIDIFLIFNMVISLEFYFSKLAVDSFIPSQKYLFDSNLFNYLYFSMAILCFLSVLVRSVYKYKELKKDKNTHFKSLIKWNIFNFNFFLTTLSMPLLGHYFYNIFSSSDISMKVNKNIYDAAKINLGIGVILLSIAAIGMLYLKKKNAGIFKKYKYLSNVLFAVSISFLMYSGLFLTGDKIHKGVKSLNLYFNKVDFFNTYMLYPIIGFISLSLVAIFLIAIKGKCVNEEYYNNKYKNINKIKVLIFFMYSFISILTTHIILNMHLGINRNILYAFAITAFGIFLNDLINRFALFFNDKSFTLKLIPEKYKKISSIICPVLFFMSLSCLCLSINFYIPSINHVNIFNTSSLTLFLSGIFLLLSGVIFNFFEIKSKNVNLDEEMRVYSHVEIDKEDINKKPLSNFFKFEKDNIDDEYETNILSENLLLNK